MADVQFHEVCGAQAAITNGGRVAERKAPESSFDKGIVFSKQPLKGRFEVRIRRKVAAWSGSIRIGVTSRSPESAAIANSSAALKGGTVILSDRDVIVDARTQQENYSSVSLKSVEVDGRVGVEIKDRALYFYINGKNQGKVETELRSQNCWAVVDLYGQCVEVEIVSSSALNVSESSSVVPEQRKVLPKGSPCQYQALVHRFFNTLVIPEIFVDSRYDCCYCIKCHAERGDLDYYNRGSPPALYAIPVGWCRLGLKLNPSAEANKVWDTHHRAYHGTAVDKIRPILDTGQLLFPGDVALGGSKISEGKGHFTDDWKPKGFNTKKIFLSPTIKYAGLEAYARKKEYVDKPTGKKYWVRVAFQVWIRAGSYDVGQSTMAGKNFDERILDQGIEWSTVERGATHFSGIVVKLEEQT
ncbi:neuralized-like protein 4 [Oscarella lobularis]|uniref:neuralized-like protein 4 n=1 Tax=Oscarella lobularis TaxID=121494 RepID=UPI0033131C49